MRRDRVGRRFQRAFLVVGAGSLLCATAAVAIGAPARHVPAKDSFQGRITEATGKFKGDHGSVAIYLHVPRSDAATRKLKLTIAGRGCQGTNQCLMLDGAPTGTITTRPGSNPDTGKRFTIEASGTVTPMGQTSVSGTGNGTGFLVKGHEQMRLTLTSADGQITVTAHSAEVPGFTSP